MRFYVYEELVMNTEKIVKYMFYSLSAVIIIAIILSIIVLITGHTLSISGSSLNYIVYILIFYLSVSLVHFIYRYRKYKTMENINTYISARKILVITSLIALELNVFTITFVVYAMYHPEFSLPIPFDPNILFISCFISITAWGISLVTVICSYFVLRRRGLL